MSAPESANAKHIACAEIVPDCSFTASASSLGSAAGATMLTESSGS